MINSNNQDDHSSYIQNVTSETSGALAPDVFMYKGILHTESNSNRSVHIIVDSCADFSPEVFKKLGVECISFPYLIDGYEYFDDMYQTTTPAEFYERIRHAKDLSTAAVSPGRYYDIFEEALSHGKPVIYAGFTEGLSRSIENARMAQAMIQDKNPDAELYVFDNLLPSMAAELLIIEMCKKADEGMEAKDLYEWALHARYFIKGVFTLDSFEFLAKGGRIPASAATTTQKLDIKPELSFDLKGALTLRGIQRGRKRALKSLAKYVIEKWDKNPSHPVAIGCADCMEDAYKLEELLRQDPAFENVEIIISPISPVLGVHVGPGMIGVSFWTQDRRKKKSIADKLTSKVKGHSK